MKYKTKQKIYGIPKNINILNERIWKSLNIKLQEQAMVRRLNEGKAQDGLIILKFCTNNLE